MTATTEDKSEAQFWAWFSKRHDEYRSVDRSTNSEDLLDRFQEQLHRYDDRLYFEISEPLKDGSNELIITAEGIRERFSKVEALVAAAPKIPEWTIIAFRPALGFEFVHEYGELKIDPRKLWFLPLIAKSAPSILGLRVGLPAFDEAAEDKIKNSVWIILDTGLGEQICAERIRHLEVVVLPEKPEEEGFIELPELPEYLAWTDKRNSEQYGGCDGEKLHS